MVRDPSLNHRVSIYRATRRPRCRIRSRDDRSYGGDSEPIGPRIENMRIRGTPAKTTMQCNGWMEGLTDLFIGGVSLHSPHIRARILMLGQRFPTFAVRRSRFNIFTSSKCSGGIATTAKIVVVLADTVVQFVKKRPR